MMKRALARYPRVLILALALASVVMSAGAAASAGQAATAGGQPPAAVKAIVSADEKALRQRVEARWKALIDGDYDRVYKEFTTPAYRKVYSKGHFQNQYGSQVIREGIEIKRVEFSDPKHTAARVALDIKFAIPGVGPTGLYHTSSYHEEAWVKVDGQWYRVEK